MMLAADMPGSTLAGMFTALFTLATAVVVTIGAVAARRTGQKVDAVHIIVNQQRTDMQRYIRAQSALLTKNGIELPIDQSIDPADLTT